MIIARKIAVTEGKGIWSSNPMVGRIRSSACRNSNGGDGYEVFEQQTFIDRSSRLELTLNRLSKWFVTALFGAVVLWRHDAEALWAAMGSILNVMLSVTLKRILNQERPVSNLGTGPGMPSSHAQSIFFSVMFITLSLVEWLGITEVTLIVSAFTLAFGAYLSWLRAAQGLHTISQVLVGAVLGSIFSILWFWSWKAFVLKAFTSILWVRIVVIVSAACFSLLFVSVIIRNWLRTKR